jgi:hypothetical protein
MKGFLAGNPATTSVWTHVPLATYVTSALFPWQQFYCAARLPNEIPTSEYQMELEITDCFINNLLYEYFYLGALHMALYNQTTTTASKIIGNGLFNQGYAPDMPCIFYLFANRSVPYIDLDPYGSVLNINFDMDMMCNKNIPGDNTFYQVSTVQW